MLTTTVGPGATPGKVYDVVVTNPGGCQAMPPFPTLTVELGPVLFMVDPFVVPNVVNARVTLYATLLSTPLPSPAVWIIPAGQLMPQTDLVTLPIDPLFPKRLQAIVPNGQAPGVYDVYLDDGGACPATVLPTGLTVTSKEDIAIKTVTPPFGSDGSNTAITIFRDTANAAKAKEFVNTPRVYLNPAKSTNPPANAKSILLTSTTFGDKDTLTAVVPAGTPVGLYDVIVVNPEPGSEVGILFDGYKEVTANAAPPVITAITPQSIKASSGQPLKVFGDDFRIGAIISASCVNTNKVAVAPPGIAGTTAPLCDGMGKNCSMQATIDGGALGSGFLCIIRVTNTDMTFGDFSALGVTNSSLNLTATTFGTDMNVARRGLGSAAAKPTSAARFVYAVAGDDGTDPNTFDDVESVSVDLLGNMGKAWAKQTYKLLQKRAFFGIAQSPHYVYVVGGTSNGTANALASSERAQVLDPVEAPILFDVDFSYDPLHVIGLAAGEWIYRVSAELDATDIHNPGGETLASDEFIIKLPAGSKLGLTIFWKAPVDCKAVLLPKVKQYHIYRTPNANDGPGKEVHLAVVPANMLSFTDDDTATKDPTHLPLRLGATGKWTNLPGLGANNERNGVAAILGVDPTTPTTKRYFYALFGKNTAGAVQSTYQYLPITVDSCGHETVDPAWKAPIASAVPARTRHMAWLIDAAGLSLLPNPPPTTNLIYVGGGINGAAMPAQVTSVFRGKIAPGGDLGVFVNTNQDLKSGGATGAGVLAAADQLFLMGGQQGANGTVAAKGVSGTIIDATGTLASNSWNSGLSLLTARAFMGTSVQSAFAFFLGGQTDAANASKTTEQVVW